MNNNKWSLLIENRIGELEEKKSRALAKEQFQLARDIDELIHINKGMLLTKNDLTKNEMRSLSNRQV